MRRDEALLLDMLVAAQRIQRFVSGMSAEEFADHEMAQSAVIRELQVIGDAARLITQETRAAHPEVQWPDVIAMRNRLVHQYFSIRLELVWQVIEND